MDCNFLELVNIYARVLADCVKADDMECSHLQINETELFTLIK